MGMCSGVANNREESFGAPDVQITPLVAPNVVICPNDSSLESASKPAPMSSYHIHINRMEQTLREVATAPSDRR